MRQLWAGIDVGKRHHHCVAVDAEGTKVFSQRIANDERDLVSLIETITELAGEDGVVTWAIDLQSGVARLVMELLRRHRQPLIYIPGRVVHHASVGYRGDGKTDATDAAIIADQARMRRDLDMLYEADETSVALDVLTSHRTDLVHDRTRAQIGYALCSARTFLHWNASSTSPTTREH